MKGLKQTWTPKEFDELINREMQRLIEDCQTLGIRKRNIPKTKVIKLLTKKVIEDEQKNKKPFLALL